jgi:hypothetical protein
MAASPSYAQVTGGVKVGVNFADLSIEDDDEIEEFDKRTGLAIGGFVEMPVAPQISIQPEVLFSQKGAKIEEGGDEFKIKFDVVQIPVLVKARFGAGATRPFVVFGPGFGFRTSAKAQFNDEEEEDLKDDTKAMDFSGIVGAGVEFGRGSVEVRYDHGFTNLDDSDEGAEAKSRTISILFGVGFGAR